MDERGRFVKGNTFGKDRKQNHLTRITRYRNELYDLLDEPGLVKELWLKLINKMAEGDMAAAKILMPYIAPPLDVLEGDPDAQSILAQLGRRQLQMKLAPRWADPEPDTSGIIDMVEVTGDNGQNGNDGST
jgi:hypothetical protein